MLAYSELTVVNNSDGVPTALGYPINSCFLQNNKPLFVGGGKKKTNDEMDENLAHKNLAVPAGLVCMTQTTCRSADSYEMDEIYPNEIDPIEDEHEIVPDGLYERLLELAEVKERKKMTKKHKPKANTHKPKANTHKPKAKSSTRKHKKN